MTTNNDGASSRPLADLNEASGLNTNTNTPAVLLEALKDDLLQWRKRNAAAIRLIPSDDGDRFEAFAKDHPVAVNVRTVEAAIESAKAADFQARYALAQAQAPQQDEGSGAARPPWRCFHCDEVCETLEAATEHFGKYQDCDPICKVGAERYRDLENQLASYRSESDETSKALYGFGANHARALIREEQKGYDRGLADGRAEALSEAVAWLKDHIKPPFTVGIERDNAFIDTILAALALPGRGVDRITPDGAWEDLIEKDDRTSPADYPEMALITFDELRDYMLSALPDHAQAGGARTAIIDRLINARDRLKSVEAYSGGEFCPVRDAREVMAEAANALSCPRGEIHIVFDGFPSHDGPRFVEVENPQGQSIGVGEWRQRPDGYTELVIPAFGAKA